MKNVILEVKGQTYNSLNFPDPAGAGSPSAWGLALRGRGAGSLLTGAAPHACIWVLR